MTVPFLIVLYFLFVGALALLAEMILPVIFSVTIPVLNALCVGSALVPLVVIYASLELADERAPILAGILGLMLDLCSEAPHRLGSSVLILSVLSALIVTQARKPESRLWLFRLTFVLVGTFGFLVVDYLSMQFETSRWVWPLSVWAKITFASLLNLALAPLVFTLIGLPPRLCGWRPEHDVSGRYPTY